MAFLLAGCTPPTRLVIVIPDGYQGFLLVRYACPGGEPIIRLDGRLIIRFRNNGTACVSDTYQDVFPSGLSQIERVQTASGNTTIPWVVDSTKAQGVGLVSISTLQSTRENVVAIFSEYWVGDMAKLRTLVEDGSYSEELGLVYEEIGLLRDGSLTPPKSVPGP